MAKYSKSEVEKIVSFSEVGLAWGEEEISMTISNIFKLGLTSVTLNFFKSLLAIWLKNGFVDVVTKLAETYIPKTFIFLKYLFTYLKTRKAVWHFLWLFKGTHFRAKKSYQRNHEQVALKVVNVQPKVVPSKQEVDNPRVHVLDWNKIRESSHSWRQPVHRSEKLLEDFTWWWQ